MTNSHEEAERAGFDSLDADSRARIEAHNEKVLRAQRIALHGEELVRTCNELRAAIDSLLGEAAGRKAADWFLINNALVDSGKVLLAVEGKP